jgi:hypothetical protein
MQDERGYDTDPRPLYGSVREPRLSTPGRSPAETGRARGPRPPARHPGLRWGSLPAARGIVIVICATLAGAIGTVAAGQAPGVILGVCLVAGSVAAALAVQLRRTYLLLPVPALAYVITGGPAGLIHDRAIDTSHTALAVNAAQWIASGFLAMFAATLLVAVIAAGRWLAVRHRQAGPGYVRRQAGASGPRGGRPSAGWPAPRRDDDYDDDYAGVRTPRAARSVRGARRDA